MEDKKLDEILAYLENIVPDITKESSEDEKQKILEYINNALKLYPKNIYILRWKASYYLDIEDYDNALLLYKEILEIDPNDKVSKESLIHCAKMKYQEITPQKNYNIDTNIQQSPDLLEKIPAGIILTVKIIALAIAIYFCCPSLFFAHNDNKILNIKDTSGFQTIKVNPLSEYDYLSKQEIYNIRKKHVNNSLFASANYEPDERIFGSIADNKPWWGTITCGQLNYKGDYHEKIEGHSKVSAQINNPNALVGLSLPFLPWEESYNQEFCTGEYGRFLPLSIQYDKKDNLIVAKYKLTERFLKYRASVNGKMTRYPIQLSGLNAKDFGYDYVYIYDLKNVSMFSENNNITEDVKRFTDYIHLGGSCGYKDGCNNISPLQYDKIITVTNLPAEINLKLWRKKPANKFIKADMYYRIIFDTK